MLYSEDDKRKQESYRIPLFGSEEESTSIPKYVLKKEPMEPRIAYQLVKDQLMDEGNARQNLATFCQTYMEKEAEILMAETLEKMQLINLNIHKRLNWKIGASIY